MRGECPEETLIRLIGQLDDEERADIAARILNWCELALRSIEMHTCHATGCDVRTRPVMFMCRRHWYMLPKRLRDEIWRTYREGQCDDKLISHEYAEAARAAVRYIAEKEGIEPDVRLYDIFDPVKPCPACGHRGCDLNCPQGGD